MYIYTYVYKYTIIHIYVCITVIDHFLSIMNQLRNASHHGSYRRVKSPNWCIRVAQESSHRPIDLFVVKYQIADEVFKFSGKEGKYRL